MSTPEYKTAEELVIDKLRARGWLVKEPGSALAVTGDADFDEIINRCIEVLESKGRDYTIGNENRLHNFDTTSEVIEMPPMKVLFVFLYKPIAAIFAYIKNNGQHESEPIRERIVDVINYLLLLWKMIQRNKNYDR
jgi:hypothetical protein